MKFIKKQKITKNNKKKKKSTHIHSRLAEMLIFSYTEKKKSCQKTEHASQNFPFHFP